MKLKTNSKAGGVSLNHNQALSLKRETVKTLQLKTKVKSGVLSQHNQNVKKLTLKKSLLKSTNLKAGAAPSNTSCGCTSPH